MDALEVRSVWLIAVIVVHHVTVKGYSRVCDDEPCLNGGQCIDLGVPGGAQEFKCSCREGFKGLTCQKKVDYCADEPCANGGTCVPNGEHYHCICRENYKGRNCDMNKNDPPETCSDEPCGDHGACQMVNDDFICECYPGYEGPRCDEAEPSNADIDSAIDEQDGAIESSLSGEVEEYTFEIKNILIVLFSLLMIILIILLLVCIHCARVYRRRSQMDTFRRARKAAGLSEPPMPGWIETSNTICNDFFCYCCADNKTKWPPPDSPPRQDGQDIWPPKRVSSFLPGQPVTYPPGPPSAHPPGPTLAYPPGPPSAHPPGPPSSYLPGRHSTYPPEPPPPAPPPEMETQWTDRRYEVSPAPSHHTWSQRPIVDDVYEPSVARLYTSDPVGPEFFAYEDPNDAAPVYDDCNVNKHVYKSNNARRTSGRKVQQRPPEHRYAAKHSGVPERSQKQRISHQVRDRSPRIPAVRAPRGSLPGFTQTSAASEKRPVTYSIPKPLSGPIRDNRWVGSDRMSKRWRSKDNDVVYFDDGVGGIDSGDYMTAYGDTSDDEHEGGAGLGYEDDGYASTGRLSESDAGGRSRDPQSVHLCSEVASRNYRDRLQQRSPAQWTGSHRERATEYSRDRSEGKLSDGEDDENEMNEGRFQESEGRNGNSNQMTDSVCDAGERRIKSILKNNKSKWPAGSVIHVRPTVVDGRRRAQIIREPDKTPCGGNRYGPHYRQHVPYQQLRAQKRSPYPPAYPPPLYEEVAYT